MKYRQKPGPEEIGSKLISALSVTQPETIPSSGIKISTRKKLELKQKEYGNTLFTLDSLL